MSNEPVPPDPELSALENALGALAPARSRIDRDRVMFLAGRAAARGPLVGRRAWMAIAASFAIVALGEAGLLARRPPPRIVEKSVVVRDPVVAPSTVPAIAPHPESPPSASADVAISLGRTPYERLAGQVLRYGLDGLPEPPAPRSSRPSATPASPLQMLHDELRNVLDHGDAS